MPKTDNTMTASAINLAEIAAHPAEALAALIQVVQSQGEEIQRLRDVHKKFAIATTNEADHVGGLTKYRARSKERHLERSSPKTTTEQNGFIRTMPEIRPGPPC